MPTGYTAPVVDSDDYTFNQFIMSCARAFGALIMMRDDPKDAEIPEKFEPSEYYIKGLQRAKDELRRLSEMSETEQVAYGQSEKEKLIVQNIEGLNTAKAENSRLRKMREQVVLWKVPTTEHQGLKDFMLQQLDVSTSDTSYYENSQLQAELRTPQEYYNTSLRAAEHDIEYYTKEKNKEEQRTSERTEWVQQLRSSLLTTA